MNVTQNVRIILLGVLLRQLELESQGEQEMAEFRSCRFGLSRQASLARATASLRLEREIEHGPAYDLTRWLDRSPTPSESASFSRTLKTMQSRGLVELYRDYGRSVTNVRLTAEGKAVAERFFRGSNNND